MSREIVPIRRIKIDVLDDHTFADLVNQMVVLSKIYAQTQQLRCRLSNALMGVLRPREDGMIEDNVLVDHGLDSSLIESAHFGPDTHLNNQDIDDLSMLTSRSEIDSMLQFEKSYANANTPGDKMLLICEFRQSCRKKALSDLMNLHTT
jgi:hypothetical protein